MMKWLRALPLVIVLLGCVAVAQQYNAIINQTTTVAAPWTFNSGDLTIAGGSGSGCVQAASGVLSVTGSNCNTNSPGNVTVGAAVSGCGTSGYVLYNNSNVVGCQATVAGTPPLGFPAYTTGASIWYRNPYVLGARPHPMSEPPITIIALHFGFMRTSRLRRSLSR